MKPDDIPKRVLQEAMTLWADTNMRMGGNAVEHIARAIIAAEQRGAERERDAWQPIETAPRDGTHILAYDRGRYFKCWCALDAYEGGYFWQDEEDSEPDPTHWRPLPEPPTALSHEEPTP